MTPMISAAIALLLTGVILVRVICVVYHTTATKHAHPLLYLGFGYSYVVLGAGAAFAAVALVADVPGADDLALWNQAIAQGKLLNPESWQRMSTSYRLRGSRPTGHGYGLFIRSVHGKTAIEHGGDIGGFSADAIRFPQEGIFIAMLTNDDAGAPAADVLAEKIAGFVLPH